jgi:hypothetical protein
MLGIFELSWLIKTLTPVAKLLPCGLTETTNENKVLI